MKSTFFLRFSDAILRFRIPLLAAVLAVTVFFAWFLPNLRFDNSDDIWFIKGDPSLKLINEFKEKFGNYDTIYLLFEAKGRFGPEIFERISRLEKDLRTGVDWVKGITWVGNAEYIESTPEGVRIRPFMETLPRDARETDQLLHKAIENHNYVNLLVSPDGRALGLILDMETYPADATDPKQRVVPAIREILSREEYRGLSPQVVGGAVYMYDYEKMTVREALFFLVICLLVDAFILLWVSRGPRGVAVPLVIVSISLVWTLGLVVLLGYTLNVLFVLVPTLLICVSIGYSMHVIAEILHQGDDGQPRRRAIRNSLSLVGVPCFLTSLTTALGFFSFMVVDIKPFRELGIYAGAGVLITLLMTYLLTPIIYSYGKQENWTVFSDPALVRRDVFDRVLSAIMRINLKYPVTLVALFVVLFGLSVWASTRVHVETNTVRNFLKDVPIRQSYDRVDEAIGSTMGMEMMLDTGREDGVKDHRFMARLDELQKEIDAHPLSTKTVSIADTIKEMRRALHRGEQDYFAIPDTDEAVAQQLLLYETAGGDYLDKFVTFDGRTARLMVKTRSLDTRDARGFIRDVEAYCSGKFPEQVKVAITGSLGWVIAMNDLVGAGTRKSFFLALIVICGFMVVMFRSLKLGLISMIPNIVPVFFTLGLMGAGSIYMDLPVMSFCSIVLGVSVDDTIHFFSRFREEFARCGRYEESLRRSMATVGRPIMFTTLALVTGLSLLAFSDLMGIIKYGLLSGFAFLWALLADLFFGPPLLLLLKPLGPERTDAGLP